jgi:REP-associated tyrosine transposase
MDFRRRKIRLDAARYKGAQWYFVTLCCAGRRTEFAAAGSARWMIEELRRQAAEHGFAVYAYCVMPDHVHALVMGVSETSDLLVFLKGLKQKTAYEFQGKFHRMLWQKRFHDHILRQEDAVERVAAYIWMNPVRKRLCKDLREYPFSGSFVIDWAKASMPVETWLPPWKEKA